MRQGWGQVRWFLAFHSSPRPCPNLAIDQVVQKACLAFPVTAYGKTQMNFSANTVQIFVDGRLYKEESVLMNGSTYSITLFDIGTKTYSVIYKEGNKVLQEGTIDFTQETPTVEQKKAILPNVTGMTEIMAKQKLTEAGFVNIVVTGASGGVVKNQIPSSVGSEIYTTETIYIELA